MEIKDEDLQALKDEKDALQKDKTRLEAEKLELEKSRGGIPKSRLDQEIEKRKASETELKDVADQLKEDVPEEFQDLIPDLPPGKLIKWLRDARTKGLFDPKDDTTTELDKKRANQKKAEDLEKLSPYDKIARGYKSS